MSWYQIGLGAIATVLALSLAANAARDDKNLVQNPKFKQAGEESLPAGWALWGQSWPGANATVRMVSDGLLVEAPGKPYGIGGVVQEVDGIEGGQAYAIEAVCELDGVKWPDRSVEVRVGWTAEGKLLHPAGWLVNGPELDGGTARFEDVLAAPEGADGARLSLEVKWPQGGTVTWRRVSIRPGTAPPPRKVKVGTVYLRPRNSTPEKNVDLWCEQIDKAGELGLDIVCLGEAILVVGTGKSHADVAEPIPGPQTERLGEAARRNGIWVIAGLVELDGELMYNTAVLMDREGKLAGKYRKVHLPREEWIKGITPGDEYPVFETDFGTIAIQICYDWFFPEPEALFAMNGAEIIFAPTWGNTNPDEGGRVDGENTFRVRARDNGVYMVPSVYSGNSLVIDPLGRILANSHGQEGVVWAEIDLNARDPLEWVGYWRSIGRRHRMPHTYGPLAQE